MQGEPVAAALSHQHQQPASAGGARRVPRCYQGDIPKINDSHYCLHSGQSPEAPAAVTEVLRALHSKSSRLCLFMQVGLARAPNLARL